MSTENHTLMLFAGNPWGRPFLLAFQGKTINDFARYAGSDLDDLGFIECEEEPQKHLGLLVWEGSAVLSLEDDVEDEDDALEYLDYFDEPGWREATKADLALFGFPLPEE